MREVLERFDFDNTISRLDESGLLFQVLERFGGVDLHPDHIDNAAMGTIFEELIRRFNEALNENPGEHFTPRDVVHLMVDLMLAGRRGRHRGQGRRPQRLRPMLRFRRDADDREGARESRPPREREPAAGSGESGRRDLPLRPRGEP